jgi:hypothetical protein
MSDKNTAFRNVTPCSKLFERFVSIYEKHGVTSQKNITPPWERQFSVCNLLCQTILHEGINLRLEVALDHLCIVYLKAFKIVSMVALLEFNDKMFSDSWIGKNVEISFCNLIWGTNPDLPGGIEEYKELSKSVFPPRFKPGFCQIGIKITVCHNAYATGYKEQSVYLIYCSICTVSVSLGRHRSVI